MIKTYKKRIFPAIITITALSVSASAAFYSVSGLSRLFAGASQEVMIMAGSLEVAKLVIASLLYQYWGKLNKMLRGYLAAAILVLMLITSMGIYGFLSAAYQETYQGLTVSTNKIEFLQNKADFYEKDVARYDKELESILESINSLSSAKARQYDVRDANSSTGFRTSISTAELTLAQKRLETEEVNRTNVQKKRNIAADSLQALKLQILDLKNNTSQTAELGPLLYLSDLLKVPMNRIVNWLLLVIIFVFDPLAIALVVVANFAFDQIRPKKNLYGEKVYDDGTLYEDSTPVEKSVSEKEPTPIQEPIEVSEESSVETSIPESEPVSKVEDDWQIVDESGKEIPDRPSGIRRILQKTPSKLRVLFQNGKEGWVAKR